MTTKNDGLAGVTGFCQACQRAFEGAYLAAPETSPLRKAAAALGSEKAAEVACRAMRDLAITELTTNAEDRLAELTLCGELAARAMVATVLAGTIQAVIAAAAAHSRAA